MKRIGALTLIFALVGCASLNQWRESHSFQRNLYVADLSIPHLTKAEWGEITAQLPEGWKFEFREAVRTSLNRAEVSLGGTYEGQRLFFERTNGKWIENKAKAVKEEYLIQ